MFDEFLVVQRRDYPAIVEGKPKRTVSSATKSITSHVPKARKQFTPRKFAEIAAQHKNLSRLFLSPPFLLARVISVFNNFLAHLIRVFRLCGADRGEVL